MKVAKNLLSRILAMGVAALALTACQDQETQTIPGLGGIVGKDVLYASPSKVPLNLQCKKNGAWTNVEKSTIQTKNGGLDNINTQGPADHPVYIHRFYFDGTYSLAGYGFYQCQGTVSSDWKKANYSFRVADNSGSLQPVFTDQEWNCFYGDPSPDFWVRTLHCDTNASKEFTALTFKLN
jgi:hypothetical protein